MPPTPLIRLFHRWPLPVAAACCIVAASASAQNCAQTSIAATALPDLVGGTYLGHQGGLYPGGQNTVPASHAALGNAAMQQVVPRDAAGAPSASGRIVLLSIGMSNTTQEFSTWMQTAGADPLRSPAVRIVDGAQGGNDAVAIANPAAPYWTVCDQRLAAAGVTPQQVQVVWMKQAIAGVSGGFPGGAQQLQGLLAQIARNIKSRYPNVRLCFVSSRTYAGYATSSLNPESYSYQSGFSVRWLIEQQMSGDPQLNSDPAAGSVVAPWIGWGPYLWTNGLVGRSDGLVWTCADVASDGTHPSVSGRTKVAGLLQQFFTTDPRCVPWYRVAQPCPEDFDHDGVVGGADLAMMLASWGVCPSGCPEDIDANGSVDGSDLGVLLSAWGACS